MAADDSFKLREPWEELTVAYDHGGIEPTEAQRQAVVLDMRLVCLAAQAFLSWHDTGELPQLLADAIDGDDLAAALDRLSGVAE
jgi:hypothetical protein